MLVTASTKQLFYVARPSTYSSFELVILGIYLTVLDNLSGVLSLCVIGLMGDLSRFKKSKNMLMVCSM